MTIMAGSFAVRQSKPFWGDSERQRIRKSDGRRDDPCAGGLRKGAWNTLCQWGRLVWIIDLDLLHDTMSEVWLFAVAD